MTQKLSASQSATLGETAHHAIQRHFKKAIKYKKAVLQDTDPENLHQMRVGLRRLRTSLVTFDFVLALPKPARSPQVAQIARPLGSVRDLDVLGENLRTHYLPALPPKEQKRLKKILRQLERQRDRQFEKMQGVLTSDRYDTFTKSYQAWIDRPHYSQDMAALPIVDYAPDLLLPLFCRLFQHPGWWVGTTYREQEIELLSGIGEDLDRLASPFAERLQGRKENPLYHQIQQQETVIHDLRKWVKQVRYQAELLSDCYGQDYQVMLEDLKLAQEILGGLQDIAVSRAVIHAGLGGKAEKKLPQLFEQFHQSTGQLWRDWQPLQQRYLNPTFRKDLKQLLLDDHQA